MLVAVPGIVRDESGSLRCKSSDWMARLRKKISRVFGYNVCRPASSDIIEVGVEYDCG
jgi:hypothetical protein